jgi:transcriptional regulator PpsR
MVQGRSFADFLARGTIDLRMLMDTVKRVGHMRHFTTRLNTDYSGQVAVELSATWFADKTAPCVGLVIRDASVAEATRWPVEVPGNDGLRNVMQLVGYSTLKDIVAETTEIIERMCIETALELTGNNRAAAAELLSLSRQSLYVKLRQFGLLSKDPAD